LIRFFGIINALGEEMNVKGIKYTITFLALLIALAHFVWPAIQIDAITVTLLIVAVLPWLSSLFKSIELPGGLKIQYQDLEKIEQRARNAGLLTDEAVKGKENYSFQTVASTDPNLAFAGLRIELEKRLLKLAESRDLKPSRRSLGGLLADLNGIELINGAERAFLSDLAALLNSAVHGAVVDPSAAEWALDIGPRILKALDERAASGEIRYRGIT
jgi:diacylglycerol kinase